MYSQHHAPMAPPQKPETFMLSSEAQQSLPQDAQVALQQVDNCAFGNQNTLGVIAIANLLSEILPYLGSCRLDTRPVHPKISFAHRRICFVCFMVQDVNSSQDIATLIY
jgi:hypothetical protein